MTTEYWVSCVSSKQSDPALAKDLYISEWFKKARAYIENRGETWFILSAKHGLVHPDEVIAPYDLTLNAMSVLARKEWTDRVLKQMGRPNKVVLLAGIRYRLFLEIKLEARGIEVEVPMRTLRIGEQLRWLNHQMSALC